MVEVLRKKQCQGEGRDIIALFHGANRLAADADGFCQVLLGDFLFLPQIAQAVIDGVFSSHIGVIVTRVSYVAKTVKGA